ncbi:MAG: DUF1540 domain-containing protein [Ruminococcaceae bacterium]|nr:DUF1540 domain-containing protein [Oscillospiraceae bacterium]
MDLFNNHENKKGHKNIKCNVCNCVYHCDDNHCGADSINVGPSFADTAAQTVCASFKKD